MNQQYTQARAGDRFVPRDDGSILLNSVTFRGSVRRNGRLTEFLLPATKKSSFSFHEQRSFQLINASNKAILNLLARNLFRL